MGFKDYLAKVVKNVKTEADRLNTPDPSIPGPIAGNVLRGLGYEAKTREILGKVPIIGEGIANTLFSPLSGMGMATVTKGPIIKMRKLTPAENKFFQEVMGNEADRLELMEQVPSVKLENGKVLVDDLHIPALDAYIDDTIRLNEGSRLPPSFHSGSFTKGMR